MTDQNEIPSTDKEKMDLLERMLYDKWKDQPATSSQKRMLRKLEIPFESDISKALASFLIREKVDGIALPTSLFQNLPTHDGRHRSNNPKEEHGKNQIHPNSTVRVSFI